MFINMKEKRYNHLNDYYKKVFGERVLKIPLDGGFSCPNRDGTKGSGGCIFCSARGSGDRLSMMPVEEQVKSYFSSFKAQKARKFIVFFQNFTNTHKPVDELKAIYDSALIHPRIVGIAIATRCDCLDEEKVKLIASYKEKYYVQVELGLQTANDENHRAINQNITNEEFINAVRLLNKYGINVVIHIMVGLPNENHDDIVETIKFLNSLNYQGLKIHSTYIEKDTVLEYLYQKGLYEPISYEYYMNELMYIISNINKDIVIHRITGDPYRKTFVAPEWTLHKKLVLNHIEELMEENDTFQGKDFKA